MVRKKTAAGVEKHSGRFFLGITHRRGPKICPLYRMNACGRSVIRCNFHLPFSLWNVWV